MNKTCSECRYFARDDIWGDHICANPKSPYKGGYIFADDCCDELEDRADDCDT